MSIGDDLAIRLKCTSCRAFRDYEAISETVVRCSECGKRHSTDSLHAVAEDEEAEFDDDPRGQP